VEGERVNGPRLNGRSRAAVTDPYPAGMRPSGSAVASVFVGLLAIPLLFAGVGGIEYGLFASADPVSRQFNLLFAVPMLPIGFGLFIVANHLWSPRTWPGSAVVTAAVAVIAAGIGVQTSFMPGPLQLAGWGLVVAGAVTVYLLARRLRRATGGGQSSP
jgi:hypothetical protein